MKHGKLDLTKKEGQKERLGGDKDEDMRHFRFGQETLRCPARGRGGQGQFAGKDGRGK